jgi:hypothetical protein
MKRNIGTTEQRFNGTMRNGITMQMAMGKKDILTH